MVGGGSRGWAVAWVARCNGLGYDAALERIRVVAGMARDSEVTAVIASHGGSPDAHRERVALEESAEIDADIRGARVRQQRRTNWSSMRSGERARGAIQVGSVNSA